MRMRISAVLVGLLMALGTVAFANPPVASAITCQDNGWWTGDGRIVTGISASLRGSGSPACRVTGIILPSHLVQLDCWKEGEGGTWSHVFDLTIGKGGWVKDSLLPGNGANVHC